MHLFLLWYNHSNGCLTFLLKLTISRKCFVHWWLVQIDLYERNELFQTRRGLDTFKFLYCIEMCACVWEWVKERKGERERECVWLWELREGNENKKTILRWNDLKDESCLLRILNKSFGVKISTLQCHFHRADLIKRFHQLWQIQNKEKTENLEFQISDFFRQN